jgi:hypothetical protein
LPDAHTGVGCAEIDSNGFALNFLCFCHCFLIAILLPGLNLTLRKRF